MDFVFSGEQEELRARVGKFVKDHLKIHVVEIDRSAKFPWDLFKKMREEKLLGLMIPKDKGGQGLGAVSSGIVVEEISRESSYFFGSLSLVHTIGGGVLMRHGSPQLIEDWLLPFMRCEKLLNLFLTEPHCGSDAAALKTTAIKDAGYYIVNGEKSQVSYAQIASAAIVIAKTDVANPHSFSAILIPMNLPGISKSAYEDMGYHGMDRGAVTFNDVKVPTSNLIGEENLGLRYTLEGFDVDRALLAMPCVGVASAALKETREYLKARSERGHAVAGDRELLSRLAELSARLEAARWLCYRTLSLYDAGAKRITQEAAMCRWYASTTALDLIDTCIQAYGEEGMMLKHLQEQRWRDVRAAKLSHGTEEINKMVIARQMLGKEFAATS